MFEDIPVIEGVYDYVNTGMVSEGAMKNRKIYSCIAEKNINLSFEKEIVLYDPQTSGGLLISIDPQQVEKAIKLLHQEGFDESKIIGEVIKSKSKERIKIC